MEEVDLTDSGSKFNFYLFASLIILIPIVLTACFIYMIIDLSLPLYYILIFNIPSYAIVGIGVPLLRHYKPRFTEPTRVLITAKGISVFVPNSKPFEIAWSEFDGIKLRVYGYPTTWDTVAEIASVATMFSNQPVYYSSSDTKSVRFHFLAHEFRKPIQKLKLRLFHDEKIKKVLQAIVNIAKNLNKGLEIHKGTKKYYQL